MDESGARDADRDERGGRRSYGGVLTAVPYAVRASDSWLFRCYAVVGSLVAAAVAVGFALAILKLLVETAGLRGGVLTLARAFFVVVALAVVVPTLAPVLLVARRHRLGRAVSRHYDASLGLAGFAFVAAVYLALVASAPPAHRTPSENPFVQWLYALPAAAAVVAPVLAAALIALAHWWGTRPDATAGERATSE